MPSTAVDESFALKAGTEDSACVGRTVVVVDTCKVGGEGIRRPVAYGGARRVSRHLKSGDE